MDDPDAKAKPPASGMTWGRDRVGGSMTDQRSATLSFPLHGEGIVRMGFIE
jgi:hypothetical protein